MESQVHLEVRSDKGDFTVIQFAPVTLGRFAQREHAELFCDAVRRQAAAIDEAGVSPVLPEEVEAEAGPDAEAVAAELLPKTAEAAPEEPPAAPEPEPPQPAPAKDSGPALVTLPVPAVQEDIPSDDPIWEKALDRLEAGARLKVVAQDLGLPFYALRARWAGAISSGSRVKPGPADGPVSGGPAGVLARGHKATWTGDQDAALMNAADENLADVARGIGVSLEDARKRRAALEARMQKLMAGD